MREWWYSCSIAWKSMIEFLCSFNMRVLLHAIYCTIPTILNLFMDSDVIGDCNGWNSIFVSGIFFDKIEDFQYTYISI